MSTTITANVSLMFETTEPYYVSNNAFTLGDCVGRITWENAVHIAENHKYWLTSDLGDAVEGMRDWARETGAWEREEIAAWSDAECLGLFVQNIAAELREHLDADNVELTKCARIYQRTNWEKESSYPIGSYYVRKRQLRVDYYTGC